MLVTHVLVDRCACVEGIFLLYGDNEMQRRCECDVESFESRLVSWFGNLEPRVT
jgi:hypothetical protein